MTGKDEKPDSAAKPRGRAGNTPRKKAAGDADKSETMSPEEARRTIHELRLHQIEIEMLNDELRRTQEKLDTARMHYFDLYDLAPVGYVSVSEKGLIMETNLTAATMLGMTRVALVRKPLTRFVYKDDQDAYYLHRKELFKTGSPQTCELRMFNNDGVLFWAHLSAALARDEDGEPVCRLVIRDFSKRKHAEEELLREQQLSKKLLAHLPGIFFLCSSPALRLVRWNGNYAALLGFSPEEMKGRSIFEWHTPEDRARVIEAVEAVMKNGQHTFTSLVLTKNSRSIPFVISFVKMELAGQTFLAGAGIDITGIANAV